MQRGEEGKTMCVHSFLELISKITVKESAVSEVLGNWDSLAGFKNPSLLTARVIPGSQ